MVNLQVNKELLPLKAHYFFFNAGTGPVVPFMPTLARQLGFSPTITGYVYTFLPVLGMLAKPLFGALADRYQMQKLLFLFFQIFTAITFFGIMFVPEAPVKREAHFECGDGSVEFERCWNETQFNGEKIQKFINNNNHQNMNCTLHCPLPDAKMWQTICNHWQAPELCANNKLYSPNDEIKILTESRLNLTEVIGTCIYFRISQVNVIGHKLVKPSCPSDEHISVRCNVFCELSEVNDLLTEVNNGDETLNTYQFWVFFILLSLSWIGMAVVVSVGDAICFEMLGDRPDRYGYQRLWGSVGWGILAMSSGFLVDYFSEGLTTKNYTIAFYLMLFMLALDLLTSYNLQYNQAKLSVNILKDVGKLLTEIRILIFSLWCIAIGMCTGLIWNFLFWHLEDLAHDSSTHIKTLEGLLMAIQCFGGELPFFFLSGFILKKLGHVNTMNLVLLSLGARLTFYSILSDPWYCLPIELLHGISFGVFYATMASYASLVAPLGTEATIQGLVGAIFEGIGVSLGSLIGGKMMNTYGGSFTFRCYGIMCFIFLILHAGVHYFLERSGRYKATNTKESHARYATPSDAIQMIDDQMEVQLETF